MPMFGTFDHSGSWRIPPATSWPTPDWSSSEKSYWPAFCLKNRTSLPVLPELAPTIFTLAPGNASSNEEISFLPIHPG